MLLLLLLVVGVGVAAAATAAPLSADWTVVMSGGHLLVAHAVELAVAVVV